MQKNRFYRFRDKADSDSCNLREVPEETAKVRLPGFLNQALKIYILLKMAFRTLL